MGKRKKAQIDWDKSYWLSADQVHEMGLDGISITDWLALP